MAELKDFIDNWQINVREKSAQHKSGLKFRYVASTESIDGIEKIEISEFNNWAASCKNKGLKSNEVYFLQKTLHKEFVTIYQQIINASSIKPISRQQNLR